MPTPDGPFALSAALNFSAMTSNAWSQEIGVNSPSLAYSPSRHPQQRLGQAVGAVHDLGEEIALHTIEAAIDLGVDVAVGRDHPAVLDRDHHAAAGAAEAAGRLVPFQLGLVAGHHDVGGLGRQSDAGHGGGGRCSLGLDDLATGELHGSTSLSLGQRFDLVEDEHGRQHAGDLADPLQPLDDAAGALGLERDDDLARRRWRRGSRCRRARPEPRAPPAARPAGRGRAGSRCAAQPTWGDAEQPAISMAATGHGATHSPQPVQAARSTSGSATRPSLGRNRIAPSGQASRQLWQTMPRRARQPSPTRACGLARSSRPPPPPSRARRESVAVLPAIRVTAPARLAAPR